MKTAKDILLKAAEIVEQGWTQGELARDENDGVRRTQRGYACKFCMTGAIFRAAGDAPEAYQVHLALTKANTIVQLRGYASIPKYNDNRSRTQAEVAEALREAAHATK
jgi:hypothetical protein